MVTTFIQIVLLNVSWERKEMLHADADMPTINYYESSYGRFKKINNYYANADTPHWRI